MYALGNEIRKARIDRGWKQKDLREKTGLTLKYLSEIENGHVDPRISIVVRIAHALGVSLDDLVQDSEDSATGGS
jgi:transcriptional regulator with XRE-family HTH domain